MVIVQGKYITNDKDLLDGPNLSTTIVKVSLVEEEAIRAIEEETPSLNPIPGTMKIHQVRTETIPCKREKSILVLPLHKC